MTQLVETPPSLQPVTTRNGKQALRVGESLVALYMLSDWWALRRRVDGVVGTQWQT